jgi:hypothetical protein
MTPDAAPSPLHAFRSALDHMPGAGEAAVVLGRAGVGKSALLVHVALERLIAGDQVLHVSLRETVDHTRTHYDEILKALRIGGDDPQGRGTEAAVRAERHRMILSLAAVPWDVSLVAHHLELLGGAAGFEPVLVVIDGFSDPSAVAETLPGLKRLAEAHGCALWLGARGDGHWKFDDATAIRLVPDGRMVRVVVDAGSRSTELDTVFDPTSLLLVQPDQLAETAPERVLPHTCTLYAGGAEGAEAAFGEAAERWGVHEVNFTFEGHPQTRSRGRYLLSEKELEVGDVSLSYVSRLLHRTYNDRGGLIRGVLQALWHMVNRSQQVFVVGVVQEDGTVVGGTGWGVELARMWNRELWVYDQERKGWVQWDGRGWTPGLPTITAPHICGTGTRYLNDHGRAAIDDLFDRSFDLPASNTGSGET